jgi:hypothetical protein
LDSAAARWCGSVAPAWPTIFATKARPRRLWLSRQSAFLTLRNEVSHGFHRDQRSHAYRNLPTNFTRRLRAAGLMARTGRARQRLGGNTAALAPPAASKPRARAKLIADGRHRLAAGLSPL